MGEAPAVYHPRDATDLYRFLDTFFRDNASHHSVELRWLAQQAIRLKALAHDLGVNGIATFQKKYAVELAELRLLEIENEREKIASADKKLAEEAARLKRGTSRQQAA